MILRLPCIATLLTAVALARDNVLLVVLDDVGVDRVGAYGAAEDPGHTPTLDQLAARGVRFGNAWAHPFCSPARAALLTGRPAFRTGIGSNVMRGGERGLPLAEITLAEALEAATEGAVHTAAIGKWHLAGAADGDDHPRRQGFDHFAGTRGNVSDYRSFLKLVDGVSRPVHRYATTEATDDALAAIQAFGDEPWFVYLAYHAAHEPYHAPPAELHTRVLEGRPEEHAAQHHKAAVEAADTELGRLLASLPLEVAARTTVVVVGDNGTQGEANEPPFRARRGKGTLFEGGLRVPLIVAGAGVRAAGARCDALVQVSDLFATVCERMGVDPTAGRPEGLPLDSISLVPYLTEPAGPSRRELAFAERFRPNHGAERALHRRAVRGARYKLVQDVLEGRERLYDLQRDPEETTDLLEERPDDPDVRRARAELLGLLERLLAG